MEIKQANGVVGMFRYDIGGKDVQLWPFLAAALLAFAWLQPHHYYPWPAFHTNALVASWMLLASVTLLAIGLRPTYWSPLTIAIVLLVLGVLAQYAGGLIVHVADAVLTSMQLLGCAMIAVTVRAVHQRYGLEKLGDVVFSGLVIAGILSVAGALYQVLRIVPQDQLAGLGVWIMAIPDGVRPAGNVAQPNEMATLLVWAMLGGVWAMHRGAIRWPVFALLAGYLALGLGITQSRVGFLEMLLVLGVLAVRRNRILGWPPAIVIALAASVQVAVFVGLPAFTESLLLDYDGRAISQLTTNTARIDIYQHVLYAISHRPWFGYGMTTLAPAQWLAADELAGLHSYFHASHNLVLDLFAWWGMPIAVAALAFLAWWAWSVVRVVQSTEQHIWACALLAFTMHAMVELPHWSAAYLFPAAVFAAALDCYVKQQRLFRVRAGFYGAALLLAAATLAAMIFDYVRLEKNFAHLRAEERRLVSVGEVPNPIVLTHLSDYLRMARMIGRPNVSNETMDWMERTVHGIPNYNTQVTHAVTLALNGRRAEALMWMRRLNSVSPISYHSDYLRVWRYFQREYPERLGDMEWPALDATPSAKPR
jgi:O-antigen ligase